MSFWQEDWQETAIWGGNFTVLNLIDIWTFFFFTSVPNITPTNTMLTLSFLWFQIALQMATESYIPNYKKILISPYSIQYLILSDLIIFSKRVDLEVF